MKGITETHLLPAGLKISLEIKPARVKLVLTFQQAAQNLPCFTKSILPIIKRDLELVKY